MHAETDWRHWLAAAAVLALLIWGAIVLVNRPAPSPSVPAGAGPQARTRDAAEFPPAAPGR